MIATRALATFVMAASAIAASTAGAQRAIGDSLTPSAHGVAAKRPDHTSTLGTPDALARQQSAAPAPLIAPLASALIPGGGQALLKQGRALPYLLLEGYAWAQYAAQQRYGRNGRETYRRLARVVARSPFSDSLPNGDFEYYETMEKYVESGAYDLAPGGPFTPESDTTTFNGAMWLLARRTFWVDPNVAPSRDSDAWKQAVDFYQRRAAHPEYRWSWRNAQLEQDLFRRTIQQSNAAFRLASNYLGIIIANHVLSTVDAFVTVRLRRGSIAPSAANTTRDDSQAFFAADDGYRAELSIPWAPFGRPRDVARQ